jgi:hypothetical protein
MTTIKQIITKTKNKEKLTKVETEMLANYIIKKFGKVYKNYTNKNLNDNIYNWK